MGFSTFLSCLNSLTMELGGARTPTQPSIVHLFTHSFIHRGGQKGRLEEGRALELDEISQEPGRSLPAKPAAGPWPLARGAVMALPETGPVRRGVEDPHVAGRLGSGTAACGHRGMAGGQDGPVQGAPCPRLQTTRGR